MPGVTVMIKGLPIGTATDRNGKYMLRLPEVKDLTLVFSFIGMESREIKYTGPVSYTHLQRFDRCSENL